jgi:hypothetical protein
VTFAEAPRLNVESLKVIQIKATITAINLKKNQN